MNLTGIKDLDFKILNDLDDKTLTSYCSTNKLAREICRDEKFWLNRILRYYGKDALRGKGDMSFSDYYKSGKVKVFVMCERIAKLPHLSQMVVDDFYNPYTGFVHSYFTRDTQLLNYLLMKIVLTRTTEEKERENFQKLVETSFEHIDEFRRGDLSINDGIMTPEELKIFYKIINVDVGRIELLKNVARVRPAIVKSLSPDPGKFFSLIAYIHKGLRNGSIPPNIVWSELCNLPYILDFPV